MEETHEQTQRLPRVRLPTHERIRDPRSGICPHFQERKPRRFTPKDNRRYSSSFTKAQRDVWFSQVWSVHGAAQSLGKLQKRSAAFPEEIPRRLVSMFSIIGDTIFDPFLGTGTTMKAACELNRNSVRLRIGCRSKGDDQRKAWR